MPVWQRQQAGLLVLAPHAEACPGRGLLFSGCRGRFAPNGTLPGLISPPGLIFAQISGGWRTVCGLTPDGAAYCMGNNLEGQLGAGGRGDQATPTPVAGGHRFARIAVGTYHVAGIELGSGAALAWGKLSSWANERCM